MRALLVLLVVAGAVVGITQVAPGVLSKVPALESLAAKMPFPVQSTDQADPQEVAQAINVDQKVLGAQTTLSAAGERLQGISALATGVLGQAVSIVSSTPTSQSDVIDVGKVSASIAQSVEDIPGTIATKAKIEYCRQVLAEATRSATPTP